MVNHIKITAPFKPLLKGGYKYYVYSSGRGQGKSINIIRCLLLKSLESPIRILCIRETQSSISESVKAEMERQINEMDLSRFFIIKQDSLETVNGSKFLFRGMKSSNAVNIKSISDISITFIEEAEAFSERSWELLVPSVMRRTQKDSIIVAALNPRFEEDVIYDRFFVKEPPPHSYIKKLTPKDNPFFNETDLAEQMKHDKRVLPYSLFAHKWLGEILELSEDCLFSKESFKLMKQSEDSFELSDYHTIVIGVDPAMTNKEHSNQFGICVVGANSKGEYHCLGNFTDNHTPHTFAEQVNALYKEYEAASVVVETNAGGDFIKSTLLLANPLMNVVEVRAIKDKTTRALPVANLAGLGKIKIFTKGQGELIRQMKCSTVLGYMGPKGESPDGLDAFCWAVYELAQLREKQTEKTVFDLKALEDTQEFSFDEGKMCFVYSDEGEVCYLYFNVTSSKTLAKLYTLNKCEVVPLRKAQDPKVLCFLPDEEVYWDWGWSKIEFYEAHKNNLDDLVASSLPQVKRANIDISKAEKSVFRGSEGNILEEALNNFRFGKNQENIIVRTFCYMWSKGLFI